jgi:hypothetical protein
MIELRSRHTFSDSARLQGFYQGTSCHLLTPTSTLLPYHMAASREPGLLQDSITLARQLSLNVGAVERT